MGVKLTKKPTAYNCSSSLYIQLIMEHIIHLSRDKKLKKIIENNENLKLEIKKK
jgi:hypothetical protein